MTAEVMYIHGELPEASVTSSSSLSNAEIVEKEEERAKLVGKGLTTTQLTFGFIF